MDVNYMSEEETEEHEKFLLNISGKMDYVNKEVKINIEGKSVIITGNNGCGKTAFLNELNKKIQLLCVKQQHDAVEKLKNNIKDYEEILKNRKKGTIDYSSLKGVIDNYRLEYEKITKGLQLEFRNVVELSSMLEDNLAIIYFFPAIRQSGIKVAGGATKANPDRTKTQQINIGINLEQHLVNLKVRQSLAKTHDKNNKLYKSVDRWFSNLEKNIAYLLEDDSFKLQFDADQFCFYLCQDKKEKYTFQTLSSGYSAIFSILSELIMQSETSKVSPDNMQGIVLIDEIDAHLHVSLQRKILPFLENNYPNIQFIVTTHSPFVIQSATDAIIYDLTRNEQVKDLSMYSYEAIIKGWLGVSPNSNTLDQEIKEIAKIINISPLDTIKLEELIKKIEPYENQLTPQSKAFLLLGKNALLDIEK